MYLFEVDCYQYIVLQSNDASNYKARCWIVNGLMQYCNRGIHKGQFMSISINGGKRRSVGSHGIYTWCFSPLQVYTWRYTWYRVMNIATLGTCIYISLSAEDK